MIALNMDTVEAIFKECLFKESEMLAGKPRHILCKGITMNVGFHPDRINRNRKAIADMLKQLPSEFQEGTGGGWTVANARLNNFGMKWAKNYVVVEWLILLGLAIGRIRYNAPREEWKKFPAGLPYFMVTLKPMKMEVQRIH